MLSDKKLLEYLYNIEQTKTANMRIPITDMLGLRPLDNFLQWFWHDRQDAPQPEKQKPKFKPEYNDYEEIDDDFFVSQLAEEAINPDDIVRKPEKQPYIKEASVGIPQLKRLRDQVYETLHYVTNKLMPESKHTPEKFNSLRELREHLKISLFSIEQTLEKIRK